MDNEQRIHNLEIYVQQWEEALANITAMRDRLIDQQDKLVVVDSEAGEKLRKRILQTDASVLEHHKLLIRMESLLGSEKSGNDA